MFHPLIYGGRNCSFEEILAVSGTGTFTFDYAYPYLYVCDETPLGVGKLLIYDVANAASPTLLSTTDLPNLSGARKPRIYGDLLYIPYRTGDALAIWDVSDRENPTLEGSVALPNGAPGGPWGVAVIGNIACVVYNGFLQATSVEKIDVSDPSNPTVVDSLLPNDPFVSSMTDVVPAGSNFVVAGIVTGGSSSGFLATVDPSTFNKLDSVNFAGSGGSIATDIAVTSDAAYAYTYDGNNTNFDTTDISDPSNILWVDSLTSTGGGASGNQHSLCLVDNTDRVYLGKAGGSAPAIYIIDISTRESPANVGTIDTSGDTISCLRKIDGCAGFAWGQGTGAAIHLVGTAPLF